MDIGNTELTRHTIALRPEAEAKVSLLMRRLGIKRSPAINLIIMRANVDALLSEPQQSTRTEDST